MRSTTWGMAALAALAAGGCSPALNWRDVATNDGLARVLLPCKPQQRTRPLQLAGAELALTLRACDAGGVTWALAEADLVDPRRATAALAELADATRANLRADTAQVLPAVVPGATPHPGSTRLALHGQLPDGRRIEAQTLVFLKGTRVYQATCVAAQLPAEAVETFFGSLRAGS